MQETINYIIGIFNANPIAQSIGLFALLMQFIIILNKDDKKYIFYQSIVHIVWTVHFLFMGLFINSVITFLNMMRGFVVLKFPKNIKLFFIFFMLYGINAIYNYQNLTSILAICAAFLGLYSFFYLSGKGIIFRLAMFLVGLLLFSYHIFNQSIGGIINNFIYSVLTFVTILRLYKGKVNLEKLKNK